MPMVSSFDGPPADSGPQLPPLDVPALSPTPSQLLVLPSPPAPPTPLLVTTTTTQQQEEQLSPSPAAPEPPPKKMLDTFVIVVRHRILAFLLTYQRPQSHGASCMRQGMHSGSRPVRLSGLEVGSQSLTMLEPCTPPTLQVLGLLAGLVILPCMCCCIGQCWRRRQQLKVRVMLAVS